MAGGERTATSPMFANKRSKSMTGVDGHVSGNLNEEQKIELVWDRGLSFSLARYTLYSGSFQHDVNDVGFYQIL